MRDLLFGLGVASTLGLCVPFYWTHPEHPGRFGDDLELIYVLLIYARILGEKAQEIVLV
jgi:hypothetical protein